MNKRINTAKKYSQIINLIRKWFKKNNFLEVFTPQLVRLPSMEPNLTPFKTEMVSFKGSKAPAYLITSPEYAMKRLLADGFKNIFQITSSFRNCEDNSHLHNAEFKILEWYRPNADYMDIAKDTENLIRYVSKKKHITYQKHKIDLTGSWEYLTCEKAFKKYANIDLKKLMKKKNFEDEFYKIFLTHIERKLGRNKPVFLTDYPLSMASLSKRKNNLYAERWELYINGIELANCFSELTDWKEQYSRLKKERLERKKLGKEDYAIDMEFINALKKGMPKAGGIALGVDRLIMILMNQKNLNSIYSIR